MLYWNTVTPLMKETLLKLMQAAEFDAFRLVGGTALSLQRGHRISIDIDLFTDASYGSIDFNIIEDSLKDNFSFVEGDFGVNPGMGKSYLIGKDADTAIKLDLYYTIDPFFQELHKEGRVRMATVEEIIAMKVDIVQRGGRKKDFWDLHEALQQYTINEMIELHRQRFEWTHNQALIRNNFIDFTLANDDLDPICLKNKEWEFIKEDIQEAVNN
jgi:hypothetical protein